MSGRRHLQHKTPGSLTSIALMILLLAPTSALAQRAYSVAIYPEAPTTHSKLKLLVNKEANGCHTVVPNAVAINWAENHFDVSLSYIETGFLCPGFIVELPFPTEVDLGIPDAPGEYTIAVYEEEGASDTGFFKQSNLIESLSITIEKPELQVFPETPLEGSTHSGVGVVRGWACDAWRVEVQFDDGPRRPVAYGTQRADTQPVCGDENNGYGMVIAWGLLGKGDHTMRTYVNNQFISEVNFSVSGLDDPFIKGLRGLYDFPDFPYSGQQTIVEWSEPDQNFIIIEQR